MSAHRRQRQEIAWCQIALEKMFWKKEKKSRQIKRVEAGRGQRGATDHVIDVE